MSARVNVPILQQISGKRNLFADRNLDNRDFSAGRSMSAPTAYDVLGPGIRWRFPRQCAHWLGMTGSDDPPNSNLSHRRTIPSGAGKERPQTMFVTICQRRLAAKFQFIRFRAVPGNLPDIFSAGGYPGLAFFLRFGIIAFSPDGKKSGSSEWENPSGTKPP